jgi:TonB family protein
MNAVSTIEPWQGKVVEGKYPLLELIGTGPRGPVFRTQVSGSNGPEPAAIKLIPIEPKHAQAELSRLVLSRALSHPNLVKIFDAGQCEIRRQPTIYVVTEFADENLAQVLPSRALTAGEAGQLLPPLLDALSYLHANGFVHGRIQPSNVMAVADTLKLSTDNLRKTEEATPLNGPVRNDLSGEKPAASDVWGIGALLVAALAPETRGQPSQQQLTLVPGSIPEPYRRIARECLRANPGDRCTLEQVKSWITTKQVPSETWADQSDFAPRGSNRLKRIGIPIATLVVLAAIVIALSSRSKTPKAAPAESVQTAPAAQTNSASATQKGTAAGAIAERVQPNVSQGARNTIHGKIRVAVRVAVDSTGNVSDATLTSAGPSKYFASKALESARKWKFTPPQVGGQPTASAWLLKYQFGRAGTEVLPTELH